MDILNLLFPKKCVVCQKIGDYLCSNCFSYLTFNSKNICLVCKRPSFNELTHVRCKKKDTIDGCFSSLSYNQTAKKLLSSFKNRPYVTQLKNLLGELFYEGLIQNENFVKQTEGSKWQIMPVPLAKEKLRKRGYNQAEILAKELGKRLKIPLKNSLPTGNFLLVDDLVVTGKTLLETTKALKKAGAKKVIGITLVRK